MKPRLSVAPFCGAMKGRGFVFLVVAITLGLATAVLAQTTPTLPASIQRPGVDPERRAILRRELARHAEVLEAQSAVLKIVSKLVGPAVVHIQANTPPEDGRIYDRANQVEESGSGVIVEFRGKHYVLTNWHVVRHATAETIRINLADGRTIRPKEMLVDPDTDVAVLTISAPDLVAAPLGDSDKLETGDFVLALGSPFGLNKSVTFGIISARGRRNLRLPGGTTRYQDFLQTDAAINPGNSGGPLVNLRGELIGINNAIASDSGANEGIGFSIPINMFMTVGRQLITTGKVVRAFLGVNLNSRFGPATASQLGLPRPTGAQVSGITPNSPADMAKLQTGDVILEFNHTPVEDDAHLVNLVSLTEVGKTVPLLVFRDHKTFVVTVEVSERSKFGQ